jgi:hypothetical protein
MPLFFARLFPFPLACGIIALAHPPYPPSLFVSQLQRNGFRPRMGRFFGLGQFILQLA